MQWSELVRVLFHEPVAKWNTIQEDEMEGKIYVWHQDMAQWFVTLTDTIVQLCKVLLAATVSHLIVTMLQQKYSVHVTKKYSRNVHLLVHDGPKQRLAESTTSCCRKRWTTSSIFSTKWCIVLMMPLFPGPCFAYLIIIFNDKSCIFLSSH